MPARDIARSPSERRRLCRLLKKQAAIILFKEGKLSSGTAATWLGIGRLAFLRMAFEAGATLLEDTTDDFARETTLL